MIAFTIDRAAQEICGQKKGTVWFHFKQILTDAVREGAIPARSAAGEPVLLTADLRAWAERLPEYQQE